MSGWRAWEVRSKRSGQESGLRAASIFPAGYLNCPGGCPELQDKVLGGQASSAGLALRPLAPGRAGLEDFPGAWGCGGAGERTPRPGTRAFHSLLRVVSPRPPPPALSPGGAGRGGVPGSGPPFPCPAPFGKSSDEPLCVSLSFLRLAVGIKEPSGDSGVSHCPIEHPLPSAPRVFHVLFGTDRKPFHCFTTWILALMKEALHQIIGGCRELLSSVRAPASSRPWAPRP